jgi:hypothetical protein
MRCHSRRDNRAIRAAASAFRQKSANWRAHTAAAIKRLVHWMNSNDARASVAACNSLLDRGYGKPVQAMEVSAPDEFEGMTDTELRAYLKAGYASLFGDRREPTDCGAETCGHAGGVGMSP